MAMSFVWQQPDRRADPSDGMDRSKLYVAMHNIMLQCNIATLLNQRGKEPS
jgi:hypothetical protein